MHDLGFLYTLYSTMLYKLTGDTAMRTLSIRAAEVLAHRYLPCLPRIRAWGRMDDLLPGGLEEELKSNNFFTRSKGLAIIDCMMNLPLLFWASKETHDPFFRFVACAHADTDTSLVHPGSTVVCAHAYRFDPDSGSPSGSSTIAAIPWGRSGRAALRGRCMVLPSRGDIPVFEDIAMPP